MTQRKNALPPITPSTRVRWFWLRHRDTIVYGMIPLIIGVAFWSFIGYEIVEAIRQIIHSACTTR